MQHPIHGMFNDEFSSPVESSEGVRIPNNKDQIESQIKPIQNVGRQLNINVDVSKTSARNQRKQEESNQLMQRSQIDNDQSDDDSDSDSDDEEDQYDVQ